MEAKERSQGRSQYRFATPLQQRHVQLRMKRKHQLIETEVPLSAINHTSLGACVKLLKVTCAVAAQGPT